MKTGPLHSANMLTVTAPPPAGSPWPFARRRDEGCRDDALPRGTRLHEFEVLGVLGAGGFGVVYLALDHTLRRSVAVKEYLPVDLARRTDTWTVAPRSEPDAPSFAAGLQSFMKEAQLLAGFDHPSLVKVHRFWKANGTAYMVMPHYPGRTLKEVQRTTGALRDEQSLRRLLHPLLCALEVLHEARVFHRDISPDNVIVLPDGKPVLLDFGSARHVVSDRTQALTAMFKPSFAAIEQYGDVPGLKQGAWTDLYALAGVMHFMITGSPPVPAALRAVNDAQPRLAASAAGKGGLSMSLLQAIDWALAVRPDERPQSVQAFRDVLDGLAPAPARNVGSAFASAAASSSAAATASAAARETATATGTPSAGASSGAAGRSPGSGARLPDRRLVHRALALVAIVAGLSVAIWVRPDPGRADAASAQAALPSRPAPPSASTGRGTATAPTARAPTEVSTDVVAGSNLAARPPAPRKEVRTSAAVLRATPAASPPRVAAAGREQSPRDLCGDRNFLSMATCMDRQCQQPSFRAHAQCESFRRYAEARRQSELAR